jgi:hypothetical protein
MKQQNNFGNDVPAAPDNIPMNTNGLVRPPVDSALGKLALTRATRTPKVNAAKPATDNPFAGSWSGDGSLHGW